MHTHRWRGFQVEGGHNRVLVLSCNVIENCAVLEGLERKRNKKGFWEKGGSGAAAVSV